jgi:hypothetical protein
LPYVFTEQGVAGISGVLTSNRAIEVNIAINYMRNFKCVLTSEFSGERSEPTGMMG